MNIVRRIIYMGGGGGGGGGGGSPTDPNFANVVLLLHGDGTNGSTSFPDSSSSNKASLLSAGVAVSTAQQKFGTGSIEATASSSRLYFADSADWSFGSGQFTVEAWVRFSSYSGASNYVIASQWSGASNLSWTFNQTSGNIRFAYSTTGVDAPAVQGAFTPSLNTWYHVAVDRDASNNIRVYVDGVVTAGPTAVASAFFASPLDLVITNDGGLARGFPGFIDEVRITKGVGRYGGAFTPPTAAFPNS